jgi:hypothetical protein
MQKDEGPSEASQGVWGVTPLDLGIGAFPRYEGSNEGKWSRANQAKSMY